MMLSKYFATRRCISTFSYLSQKIEQAAMIKGDEVQETKPSNAKGSGTEIRMIVKSFERPVWLPPHTKKVSLPESRSLYTVLRSPHVDKKSREQYHMKVKKQLLVINAEPHELSKKYFWMKRLRLIGAQFEIVFNCKTRLDKNKVQALLNRCKSGTGTSDAEN